MVDLVESDDPLPYSLFMLHSPVLCMLHGHNVTHFTRLEAFSMYSISAISIAVTIALHSCNVYMYMYMYMYCVFQLCTLMLRHGMIGI